MNENWQELRPRLVSIAFRILGCVADAEDAVQDAFLCLHTTQGVTSVEGFLVKTTTHRCIDQLRKRRRKEEYLRSNSLGGWSDRPTWRAHGDRPSLGRAFLYMIERLSASECATFLLRIAFQYEYAAIAKVVKKQEAHVRQIFRRAAIHLLEAQPRFNSKMEVAEKLAERFVVASQAGHLRAIEQLFDDSVNVPLQGSKLSAAA